MPRDYQTNAAISKAFDDYLAAAGVDKSGIALGDAGDAVAEAQRKYLAKLAATTPTAGAGGTGSSSSSGSSSSTTGSSTTSSDSTTTTDTVTSGGESAAFKELAKLLGGGPKLSSKAFTDLIGLEKTNRTLNLKERQGLATLASDFYNKSEDREFKKATQRQYTTRDYLKLIATSNQAAARVQASVRGQTLSSRARAASTAESTRSHKVTASQRAASQAETKRSHQANEKAAQQRIKAQKNKKTGGLTPASVNTVYRSAVSLAKGLYGTSSGGGPPAGLSAAQWAALSPAARALIGGGTSGSTKKQVPRPKAYSQVRTYINGQIRGLTVNQTEPDDGEGAPRRRLQEGGPEEEADSQ